MGVIVDSLSRIGKKHRHAPEDHVSRAFSARPVAALYWAAVLLSVIGAAAVVYRFAVGLGASTALTDGYPWGLWIAFDVVIGTGLATGGYAMAILVYIFNKGRYHPLVRPAIVTSALGYTLAAFSVAIDVGRPWLLWRVPLFVWEWNVNSVLLEVAVCIMAYVLVAWIELTPAFLERWKEAGSAKLRAFAEKALPRVEKALIYVIALGIVLPTMHQSSLGSLMLLSGPKLHGLWNTGFLPLFFLMTCVAMGFAVVAGESTWSHLAIGRKPEKKMLASLEGVAISLLTLFVLMRFFDAGARGVLATAFQPTLIALAFWVETALFLAPLALRLMRRGAPSTRGLVASAVAVLAGGALYRLNTFLVAYDPGPGYQYFPSVTEILISVGIVAIQVVAYITIVRKFPILRGTTEPAH
jgi:Ni/Fe-hydrogenase subunit HybB-like protein